MIRKKLFIIKNLLFFPGFIFHELSHLLFIFLTHAELSKFNIEESKISIEYNNSKNSFAQNYLINISPFIINNILIIFLLIYLQIDLLLFYIISCLFITSFPSSKDFYNIKRKNNSNSYCFNILIPFSIFLKYINIYNIDFYIVLIVFIIYIV